MFHFLSKKVTIILVIAFALWAIPPQVFAADDAQDIEDAQNLSTTLMIVGLGLAVTALVIVIVSSSVKRNKAKNEFELKGKQSDAQKEFAALGGIIYRKLVEENSESVNRNDEDIIPVIDSINAIGDTIKALEEKIAELKKD